MTEKNKHKSSSSKKLVVIADRQTVTFFKLIGAVGFEIDIEKFNKKDNKTNFLREALLFIKNNVRGIGAMLVANEIESEIKDRLERIQGVELPIVSLPDKSGKSKAKSLESLMERAVGMKLNI